MVLPEQRQYYEKLCGFGSSASDGVNLEAMVTVGTAAGPKAFSYPSGGIMVTEVIADPKAESCVKESGILDC